MKNFEFMDGNGLGLAIALEILRLHDGKIGTKFTVLKLERGTLRKLPHV